MDLTTQYLGLTLKNPLVPSASPLSRSVEMAREMEDAGASAIIMYSLFEEAVTADTENSARFLSHQSTGFAEAETFLPDFHDYEHGLDVYLNNPLAYVANLAGEPLDRVRRNTHLVLVCGQGAYEEGCIEEPQALADLFDQKGIPHQRDIWGHDVAHQWPWWKRQARYHLAQRFGMPD